MTFVYKFKVRFSDTDTYGIIHHSSFFIYFEEARYSFSKNVLKIFDSDTFNEFKFPVLRAECNYRSPLFYDLKDYEVKVDLQLFQANRILFKYTINKSGDSKILATGKTVHAIVENERLCLSIPEKLEEAIKIAGIF